MIVSIILQVLLGLGFFMFGYQKFTSEDMKKGFEYFGYGDRFRLFTGTFEIVTAIVIIIGIWIKPLAAVGGLMIIATMIGAIMTHVKMKDGVQSIVMPFVLLVLGVVVTSFNWSSIF